MIRLHAENVLFAYRDEPVLHGVDFMLNEGEMAALVGPNGAGKSTLLKILCRLLYPNAGRVRYRDRDLNDWPSAELARNLAVVPQTAAFHFPFTVGQYVLLARHPYRGWSPFESDDDVAAAERALAQTGLSDLAERSVLELSGGEQQRAALAAALAQQPDTMLLDEPTASLDLRHQVDIYATLRRLNTESGLTVLVVTHDLNLAARYCPRLVLMDEGRIVADGSPGEILDPALIRKHYRVEVEVGRRADGITPYLLPTGGSAD